MRKLLGRGACDRKNAIVGDATPEVKLDKQPLGHRLRDLVGEAYDVVRVLLAVLLLAAAGLKTHQLATGPAPGQDILTHRWSLIAQTELEIVLGLWLLGGPLRRLGWAAALACFVGFSGVTFFKGIRGDASCDCFGRVQVHPWITLILDLAIVAALLIFRPKLKQPRRPRKQRLRLAVMVVIALAAVIPAGLVMATYSPARLTDSGRIVGDARIVVLEPETWAGKPLPLLRYIDIADGLTKGKWIVVLYHYDCPHCRKAIPKYEARARKMTDQRGSPRVALIEMPPYSPAGKSLVSAATACTVGRLSDVRDWFAATPVVIELADGTVIRARQRPSGVVIAPSSPVAFPSSAPVVLVTGDQAEHDFGFVKPKAVAYVTFSLRNPAKSPLRVHKIRNECKCMVILAAPKLIKPESSDMVKVKFIAPKDNTTYSKRIVLLTADPARPIITLRIKASVGLPLEVQPRQLDLGTLVRGRQREVNVTILNRGDRPVRPVYATSSRAACTALIPRALIPAGGKLSIPILIKTQDAPPGGQTATISIHTDCSSQPVVNLQLRYQVSPAR